MQDLKSLDNLYLTLGFLVPGLIVLFVRSQFVTGRRPPHAAALLSYLTVSVIYYALALPFADSVIAIEEPGYPKALTWFGLVLRDRPFSDSFSGSTSTRDYFAAF